jgi:hypothetical protein
MAISETLKSLCQNWSVAQPGIHRGQVTQFRFRCTMEPSGPSLESDTVLPSDVRDFWNTASGARLFEDVDYGQWGLVLLSTGESASATARFRQERSRDTIPGDMVIGYFLGDQDVLLVRTDPNMPDFGQILVALPLDARDDWYRAAPTLDAFLGKLSEAQGDKFWEER